MKRANTLFAKYAKSKTRAIFLMASILVLVFSIFTPFLSAQAVPAPAPVTNRAVAAPASTATTDSASTAKTDQASPQKSETCEEAAGPLSFFLCPVLNLVVKPINWFTNPENGALVSLLKVEPLQFNNDQGLQRAYLNVLNFTNSLFILVFLVIIFANLISDFNFLSGYNVRNTLPRLFAAIILAQFGYLLCAMLIDIGNILGTLLPSAIMQGVLGPNVAPPNLSDAVLSLLAFGNPEVVGAGTATVTTLLFGGAGGVVFLLVLIMAILALFSLLLAFFYMVARYLVLIMLIFSAPLAFLAFVLPGTQKFFYGWGKNLLRLVFMFPLVAVLITTAEVVSFMLIHPTFDPTVFTDDRYKLLIGGLVPFVALLLIPKCLKLSGSLVEATGGAVAGFVAGKASGQLRGQTSGAISGGRDRVAETQFGKDNRFGRAIAGGGAMAVASPYGSKTIARLGEARNRASSVYDKAGSVGTEKELKAMLGSKNTVTRQAAIKSLAKSGNRAAIQEAFDKKQIKPIDMAALKTTDFKEFGGMPDIREYKLGADGSYSFDEGKFFSGVNAGTVSDAGGSTQKEWFLKNTVDQDGKPSYGSYSAGKIQRLQASQLQNILRSKDVQVKMSEDVRRGLSAYAGDYGSSDAHGAAILSAMDTNGVWKK